MKKSILSILLFFSLCSCQTKVDLNGTLVDDGKRAPNVDLILVDSQTFEEITRSKTDVDGHFVFSSIPKGNFVIIAKDPMGGGMYASQIRAFKESDHLLDANKINYSSGLFKKFFENEHIIDSLENAESNYEILSRKIDLGHTQDSIARLIFDEKKQPFWYWSDPLMYFTTYHFVQVKSENENNITIDIDISHLY